MVTTLFKPTWWAHVRKKRRNLRKKNLSNWNAFPRSPWKARWSECKDLEWTAALKMSTWWLNCYKFKIFKVKQKDLIEACGFLDSGFTLGRRKLFESFRLQLHEESWLAIWKFPNFFILKAPMISNCPGNQDQIPLKKPNKTKAQNL